MTRYTANFVIFPPGAFGLPDGDKIVRPPDSDGLFHFNIPIVFDERERKKVVETHSIYRKEPLKTKLIGSNPGFKVTDNILAISLEAESDKAARELLDNFAKRFIQVLCLLNEGTSCFWFEMKDIATEDGRVLPRRHITKTSAQGYRLDRLSDEMESAAKLLEVHDNVVNKALHYFYHAVLLMKLGSDFDLPDSYHQVFLDSQIILFCYKAAVTIIGERGKDRDYQSRYKSLGIPRRIFEDVNGRLKTIRDDFDVAHHSPEWKVEEIGNNRAFAFLTAKRTIYYYLKKRLEQETGHTLVGISEELARIE